MSWHIAETREWARAAAREGLLRHHNEYITATLQRCAIGGSGEGAIRE